MPQNKQLKAGLEGLVLDNANNRTLVDQRPPAPDTSFTPTGKPDSQTKISATGSTCRFDTSN